MLSRRLTLVQIGTEGVLELLLGAKEVSNKNFRLDIRYNALSREDMDEDTVMRFEDCFKAISDKNSNNPNAKVRILLDSTARKLLEDLFEDDSPDSNTMSCAD